MATEHSPSTDLGDGVSRWRGAAFRVLTLGATLFGIVALFVLLLYVAYDAVNWLSLVGEEPTVLSYLTNPSSRFPEEAGIYPALVGSVFMMVFVALMAFPLGVGTAIYLEEYAGDGRLTQLIQVNISNLAGVPSVVYGILGLAVFVRTLGMDYGTVIVGAATISLLILPIVIISSQEAIRSVPDSLRQASYGMGATRWQTIREVVLPNALPGILTGTILALGRAIGETAPLIMIGFASAIYTAPTSPFDKASAMPMQIFAWADLPQPEFQHGVVAAGVVVLLVVLLTMNGVAIYIRNKFQKQGV
ncbi:phosphate ABC transporter permease PstA [Halobacteriaceae archaeon GCM10025711]